jgi:hypothetical protein
VISWSSVQESIAVSILEELEDSPAFMYLEWAHLGLCPSRDYRVGRFRPEVIMRTISKGYRTLDNVHGCRCSISAEHISVHSNA